MTSYEEQIHESIEERKALPDKLDIGTIKYFWQTNPLISRNKHSVPRFLRTMKLFSNFSDIELSILAKYLHLRHFNPGEVIFKQNQEGIGFYFIYTGQVDISVNEMEKVEGKKEITMCTRHVITLEKGEHFGEIALLQERSLRSATSTAKNAVQLFGIFKPDVDILIKERPVIAAKLLQSLAAIVANRFYSIAKEVGELKYKICQLEVKDAGDQ